MIGIEAQVYRLAQERPPHRRGRYLGRRGFRSGRPAFGFQRGPHSWDKRLKQLSDQHLRLATQFLPTPPARVKAHYPGRLSALRCVCPVGNPGRRVALPRRILRAVHTGVHQWPPFAIPPLITKILPVYRNSTIDAPGSGSRRWNQSAQIFFKESSLVAVGEG